MINLMAVAEFLENVDLATLGLVVVPTVRQGVKAEGASRPWLSPVVSKLYCYALSADRLM